MFSRRQCPQILLCLFGLVFLPIASTYKICQDHQFCNCTTDYINCTCFQNEDITIEESGGFSGKELIIYGCGKVKLTKICLEKINVKSVLLSNLIELEIEPNAFDGGSISNLYVSNIKDFRLGSFGFANIGNVANITIRNVTLLNLERAAFTDTKVPHLVIRNSHIGNVPLQSLHLKDTESVTIENNTIAMLITNAISIINATKFSFIHNSVKSTGFGCITLAQTKDVDFGYCHFLKIVENAIITKEVDALSFHNNYINTCEGNAFWGINPGKQVIFSENEFLVAKKDSLIPNLGPNQPTNSAIIVNENNKIRCDCNIDWLLTPNNPKYELIKEKNFCNQPQNLEGLKLSLLTMTLDEENNCSSIEMLTTTGAPTTMPTTIETEKDPEDPITTSFNEDLAQTASSTNQSKKHEPTSQHAKQRTGTSSGNMCICNTAFLFSMLAISIS